MPKDVSPVITDVDNVILLEIKNVMVQLFVNLVFILKLIPLNNALYVLSVNVKPVQLEMIVLSVSQDIHYGKIVKLQRQLLMTLNVLLAILGAKLVILKK